MTTALQQTILTEQCGAKWVAIANDSSIPKNRAIWVFLVSGVSLALPGVVGFYASSIDDACDSLSN